MADDDSRRGLPRLGRRTPLYARTRLHPLYPVMYFDNFKVTKTLALKYNDVPYYENNEAHERCVSMTSNVLCTDLAQSHADTTTQQHPERLMTLCVGDTRPAHLPLLTDLDGYLHKGVSCFVKWLCENAPSATVGDNVIQPQLTPIFDLKPEVDPNKVPCYSLPIKKSYIFFKASNHALHVMKVTQFITLINIHVYSDITKDTKLRYHYVSIEGEQEIDYDNDRSEFQQGTTVILWNARGILRPSFAEKFDKLYEAFSPMVVVMTEARACVGMIDFINAQLQGVFNVDVFGRNDGYGGVALLWDKVGLHSWPLHRRNDNFGHMMGVSIQPGWKIKREPSPYVSNWYSNAGLDIDGTVHDYSYSPCTPPSPKKLCFSIDGDF